MSERTDTGTYADPQLLLNGMGRLRSVMERLGYSGFKPGQEPVVYSIMSGRDTMCVLPTGAGKSACFIIPSLCQQWKTIVFSPLLALMRDQVQALRASGIRADEINSNRTMAENFLALREWLSGDLEFLYVAPERLNQSEFIAAIAQQPPEHVVLDEAHTLSQWSDNFRPAYCKVGDFIADFQPKVVSTFTATSTRQVEEDIKRVLGVEDINRLVYYPRRENLHLKSEDFTSDVQLARRVKKEAGCGIIYCSTIKNVEMCASILSAHLEPGEAVWYHGQLDANVKRYNQDLFMSGEARVVVATNAFGMGVDKPDIRFVYHRDMPGSLEQLSQEVGRGGRDGKDTQCVAFYSVKGEETQEFFLQSAHPSADEITRVFNILSRHADEKNEVRMTGNDIAKQAGVSAFKISSIFSILTGAGVCSRQPNKQKVIAVRLPDKVPDPGTKLEMGCGFIREGGVVKPDGYHEIDLEWLSSRWGVTIPTVLGYLKDWDRSKQINYVPAYSGSVTTMTGPLTAVDFDRLQQARQEAYANFDLVREYYKIPDEQKHDYLEKYFLDRNK